MKCAKCKVEMMEGWLATPGTIATCWQEWLFKGKQLRAFNCPKCSKIELYTK